MRNWMNVVVGSVVLLALLALGLWRLQLEHTDARLDDRQLALVETCLPPIEVPAGSLVFASVEPPAQAASGPVRPRTATRFELPATVVAAAKLVEADGDATAAAPLRLRQSHGAGLLEMNPPTDRPLTLRFNGADHVLDPRDHPSARFGPAANASYAFVAANPKAITTAADGSRTVAAGAVGTVKVDGAVSLQVLHPLLLGRSAQPPPAALRPIRVSGQPGLSSVSVEVRQPGLRLDDSKVSLSACAWDSARNIWRRATVAETNAPAAGHAKVLIALPDGAFPRGNDWKEPVVLALASSDGRYLEVGSFIAVSRLWAATGATVLMLVLLGSVMGLRAWQLGPDASGGRPWISGLFTGPDGDPSLSLWQTFVWTVVTVWGMLYVFIVAGSLLVLTTEVMGLLGIAGTGSVLARFIASSGGSTSQNTRSAAPRTAGAPARPHLFWQMLSTNNSFDLLKLQLFVFTVVIALYVVSRIADAAAFPALDANTLLLMGVSQGVYITSKAATATSIARAVALKAEIDTLAEQQKNLEGRKAVAATNRQAVDAAITAAGVAPPAALLSQRDDLVAEIGRIDLQIEAAKNKAAALRLDFDRMVKELGLA